MTDNIKNEYSKDTEVYLDGNPGTRGRVTGKNRPMSDGHYHQVRWQDGQAGWYPDYQLKIVEDEPDVFALLRRKEFGRCGDLRRNLTFIQLSGKLADVVYSMDTTNTDYMPYQYKPVLAFLASPSSGLLIADEVGLGKTIEAGLIWTELRARYNSRRLVVVCPAMLVEKWCDELNTRFGLDARQCSAEELDKELRRKKHLVPVGRAYVCSLQELRPRKRWRDDNHKNKNKQAQLALLLDELAGTEPVIDLLIVDEAHHLRNPATQNAVLGELLRDVSEHVVLLSATPINNQERDLFSLLKLVDPDTFKDEKLFSQVLAANEPLLQARTDALDPKANGDKIKQHLQAAADHSLLKGNKQLAGILARDLTDEYLADRAYRVDLANRIARINLLSHAVNRTRKVEVQELKVIREPKSYFVPLDNQEKIFYQSVTDSIRKYARDRGISDGFLLSSPQRQVSSCMYAAAQFWKSRKSEPLDLERLLYEDLGASDIDIKKREVYPLIDHIAKNVLSGIDIPALRKSDSKFQKFSRVVHEYLQEHQGQKVIVFSYFKATLYYLKERLEEEGLTIQLLHGGIRQTKQDVIDQFRENPDICVLLTSEVASEGVDLQFCKVLINYDLPWNPMKIEQRIGRVDRIGQPADKVTIINLGYEDTIDNRIYNRLLKKLGIFKRALGNVEAILGSKLNELTSELLSAPLTPEQEQQRIDETYTAIETRRKTQEELEDNAAHLMAHGDFILERVQAAHEFERRITAQDLKLYVKDFLSKYCKGFEFIESDREPMRVKIKFPAKTAVEFGEFVRKNEMQGESRLSRGMPVNCYFENKVGKSGALGREEEAISQFHPLIRFISERLTVQKEYFHSLVVVRLSHRISSAPDPGRFAFAVNRWTFSGLRTVEHMRARSVRLDDNTLLEPDPSLGLVNLARVEGDDWLSARNELSGHLDSVENAISKCDNYLFEDYLRAEAEHENENADRIAFRIQSAENGKDRLLNNQNELLYRYRQEKNEPLIRLTEGKIKKIQTRFDLEIEKIKQKEKMNAYCDNDVYGVILVD